MSGDASTSGEPDIDVCYKGRTIKLEVKRPGGAGPTNLQKAVLAQWREAGAVATTVRSVDAVREIIKTLDSGEDWTEGGR